MDDSWDWLTNTQTGADIFAQKVRSAKTFERKLRKQYRGLRALTDVERENMALVLYGPKADPDPLKQYYIPQMIGSIWDWVVNTANNPQGVAYADNVRTLVQ
jgi:hypothetical protein